MKIISYPVAKQHTKTQFLSFKSTEDLITRLDYLAEQIGVSRSALVRILLNESLTQRGVPLLKKH